MKMSMYRFQPRTSNIPSTCTTVGQTDSLFYKKVKNNNVSTARPRDTRFLIGSKNTDFGQKPFGSFLESPFGFPF